MLPSCYFTDKQIEKGWVMWEKGRIDISLQQEGKDFKKGHLRNGTCTLNTITEEHNLVSHIE
jgi:hypothetical protein